MSAFERACVAGLELHLFRPPVPDAPVVLVTHGRGGRLADTHSLCRALVRRGVLAVGVEQRNHGARQVDAAANGYAPSHASDLYGTFVGTAHDLGLLVDFLPARLGVDTRRVGVTGVSLGAHAALVAMGLDARFTACAAFIGSGDYRSLMGYRHRLPEFAGLSWDEFYPAALDAAVRRFDPLHRPGAFTRRPVLLVNGGADTLVPAACNQSFVAAVAATGAPGPELRVYPGVGHEVTPQMEEEALDWLVRHL